MSYSMESVLVTQPNKVNATFSVPVLSENVGTCMSGPNHIILSTNEATNTSQAGTDIHDDTKFVVNGHENILLLQIENQDDTTSRGNDNQEGTQVFFIYQDIHTCGVCNKQSYDLIEFIAHKSEHTIGDNIYKCELCKEILLDQVTLLKHYNNIHAVKNLNTLCGDQKGESVHIRTETVEVFGTNDQKKIAESPNDMPETVVEGTEISRTKPRRGGRKVNTPDKLRTQSWHSSSTAKRNPWKSRSGKRTLPTLLRKRGVTNRKEQNESKGDDPTNEDTQTIQEDIVTSGENDITAACNDDGMEESMDKKDVQEFDITDENQLVEETNSTVPDNEPTEQVDAKDFSFVLLTEIVKGNTFSYGRVWFKCLHCDYKTRSKLGLSHHMSQKHETLLDVHEDFDIKPSANRLGDKVKIMKMSTYDAMHCQERKVRRKKRQRKIEKQDVPGAYPCTQCGKIFSRIRYLRKHHLTHRTERKFVCDECGKPFKSRTYLRVHKQGVHQNKVFNCNQCDFSSSTKAAIHAHRQIHNQGSAICDICGYAYNSKSTLNKHKRVHDANRPFACSFTGCTWRFKTEVMCKAHIRAHTTEGKFRCSYCGYMFRHKHHLKRHESNMHGINSTGGQGNQISTPILDHVDEKSLDNINVVISSEIPADQLHLTQGLGSAHFVVATDNNVGSIAYETDISTFCNAAYQTLSAHPDVVSEVEGHVEEDQTILVSSTSDTHAIIFQQE